jgi:hypothetical protein
MQLLGFVWDALFRTHFLDFIKLKRNKITKRYIRVCWLSENQVKACATNEKMHRERKFLYEMVPERALCFGFYYGQQKKTI